MSRFIFVTGGVVSSLGKGIATASLALLLKLRGFKVRARKFDPYFNVDSGTMSPEEHGEVFITDDGAETDLDIGHYERFTEIDASGQDSITMGKVLFRVLGKERKGDYLGKTVQVVPHVTNTIKEFIVNGQDDVDFTICEIGGTVGDIEALPFFESMRQLRYELGRDKTMYMHVTLLPFLETTRELKTKPTQHSIKELRSIGIQPDILLCRAHKNIITNKEINKIGLMCGLSSQDMIIPAPDVSSIYEVPLVYNQFKLDEMVVKYFGIENKQPDLQNWIKLVDSFNNPKKVIKIALVGKYTKFGDAYLSIIEALNHSGMYHKTRIEIVMINSRKTSKKEDLEELLQNVDGILIPGGFGIEGVEGKILAIQYARENNIPFFGICFGMQVAVIEAARNVLGYKDAISTELNDTGTIFVGLMEEWVNKEKGTEKRTNDSNKGGTMRLGLYTCTLRENSRVREIYKKEHIKERHRHRFEINNNYVDDFKEHNIIFSGTSLDGSVIEIMEIPTHRWFVATQFHPEFQSKIFKPHPLFTSFIGAAISYSDEREGKKK